MAREKVGRLQRVLCIGDLDKRITLHTRSIKSPAQGAADFTEKFSESVDVWAKIETATGKTVFDGVSTDLTVTHEMFVRGRPGLTSETWIEHKDKLFDIVVKEDYEEDGDYFKLSCSIRGDRTKASAQV